MRVDPAPLLATFGDLDTFAIADHLGVSARTIIRWRHHGHHITMVAADRYATAIGRHPAELWPDYWTWPTSGQAELLDHLELPA